MDKNQNIRPILKWAGGKRQLLPEIKKRIPNKISDYYEPFLGGGALLFSLQPQKAVVNDINEELINLYKVVQTDVDALIIELKKHKNEADYFYTVREMDRDEIKYKQMTAVQRASRILYLNKTCYNGLFRVNAQGHFNVPFGRHKNPNIVNENILKAVGEYLKKANITFKCCDFEGAVDGASKDSFIYFDPPYDPISDTSSFTGYGKDGFDRNEQKRLKELCDKLNRRGVRFLLSNSKTDFILELYKEYKIEIIQAKRVVNSKGDRRGGVDEVLVRNYE